MTGPNNPGIGRVMNRTKKTPEAVRVLVGAVAGGLTLARAAALAGVHVATVCRWQAGDHKLQRSLRAASLSAAIDRYSARPRCRPRVPWHPHCPRCRAAAEVRRAAGCLTFWRCSRWPGCGWASWRPRHPHDCPGCGGPRFWSHSRLSASCPACRVRIMAL